MKKIIAICSTLFFCSCSLAQPSAWISFKWHEEIFKGRRFDKAAIYIPVRLDSLPHSFVMQFDIGVDETFVYGNTLKPFLKEYDELEKKIDTTLPFWMNNKKIPGLKGIDLQLGNVSFGSTNVGYLKHYGKSLGKHTLNSTTEILIGTLGTDLFKNSILIIDYPNKRICRADEIPKEYANVEFQPFKTKFGHIIITLTINGKQEDVLYDTGTGGDALETSENNAAQVSESVNTDSFKTISWGKVFMVYGRKSTGTITFGKKVLNPGSALVFYDKEGQFSKTNEELHIWGTIGNGYFLNNVIIIDWKNKMFGIQ